MNQSLVDDGLVEKEKIGGANYFWSFPSKKDRLLQLQHEDCLKNIESIKTTLVDVHSKLADAKRGREEEEEDKENNNNSIGRAMKLQRLTRATKERFALETELETLKENDPQALADLQLELRYVTEAAHRWTDNIFSCKAYLTKKRGLDKKEACRILGINSAFDCELSE